MKHFLFLILTALIPLFTQAQSSDSNRQFGFVMNSSLNGELNPIRLVPSLTYYKGSSQFELGFGFHPFCGQNERLLSCEGNYKYFPNGIRNKFSMYFVARFSYVNNARDTYFPATYNYLFLNGGYGFEVNAFKGAYLGTNLSAGGFTYGKHSENPYANFDKSDMFDELGFNLAFQFNVGYRF